MKALKQYHSLVLAIAMIFGCQWFFACSEKPAQTANTPGSTTGGSTSGQTTSDDPDGGDTEGEGGGEGGETTGSSDTNDGSFDLCKAMESNDKLDDFSDQVGLLCGDNIIKTLRKEDNLYVGDEDNPTVKTGNKKTDGNEITFRLYSASLVPVPVEKYKDMLKLQFFEPADYKEDFETDEFLDKYEILDSSNSTVEYHYINSREEASPVDYEAKTTFVTLEKDVAYAVVTELTKSYETMLDLKGIIIINKVGNKTETFTVSDQTYDKGTQSDDVAQKRAQDALEDEQKRAYRNGVDANDKL